MYIIRMKKNAEIVLEYAAPLDTHLSGKDIYPAFNARTMELLKYDGESLPTHYAVTPEGFIVPKTIEALAAEGLIQFGENLNLYGAHIPTGDDGHLREMNLALKLNLIKTYQHCLQAFRKLDDEFEARVAQKFRPGLEAKIMKDYMDWMDEGKPANDKREQKYLDMKQTIDAIKEEYKEARAKLKEIITPLKEQEA